VKESGYDNQKGKKKMNEKGRMEMKEKDGEKGKVESCVRSIIDLSEQLRWMHDGETDLCLSHDSSRGGAEEVSSVYHNALRFWTIVYILPIRLRSSLSHRIGIGLSVRWLSL
jgi:hypothetical protein